VRTEDLIADLASRAAPVRPLPSPGVRLLEWAGVAIGCGAISIAAFGARPDIREALGQAEFITDAMVALGTAALGGAASLVLAIPGARRSTALQRSTMAIVGLWTVVLVAGIIRAGHGFAAASDWPVCFIRVVAIGLVPAAVLFGMLRRSAPLQLSRTGALAAAAAMATGALALQFICPQTDAGHLLLGHLAPVFVMGAVGALLLKHLMNERDRN
jgi:hypothetical protein